MRPPAGSPARHHTVQGAPGLDAAGPAAAVGGDYDEDEDEEEMSYIEMMCAAGSKMTTSAAPILAGQNGPPGLVHDK